jgi:homoserine dehydrogenase
MTPSRWPARRRGRLRGTDGRHDGPARAATEAAIAAGKDVVTANKALLAHHGQHLAEAAEAKGHLIRFEAAVAGGIPVIKALTEGLAGNGSPASWA